MTYSSQPKLQGRKRPVRTFRAFVRAAEMRDGPPSDFAADVKADPDFPYAQSWRGVLRYLRNANACDGAIVAAEECWELWEEYRAERSRALYRSRIITPEINSNIRTGRLFDTPIEQLSAHDRGRRQIALRCMRG